MAPKKIVTMKAQNTKKCDISEKYKKMDQHEHVLAKPGMYIGSIEVDACDVWVVDEGKMIKKTVKYIPGLFKIYDEIIVNAIDQAVRLKGLKAETGAATINLVKNIRITISKDTGIIEVTNDGDGIEIVEHPEHAIYIPEMIFGYLLTSTNYDDTEERIVGGTNGLGAKLTNIFSQWFEVETVDASRKLHYKQRFCDNMTSKEPPTITKFTKKPYTTIRFLPDYTRFGMPNLTDDMYQMMVKRAYDVCAVTDNDITVYLNDTKLEYKTFEKYVDLYLGGKDQHTRVFEKINDRWEIVASYNNFNGFEQVSFVNGIWTIRGGKHVDYIMNQIVKDLTEIIQKKKKDVTIKPQAIKDNLILFVKSTIVNPAFDSQSKETLTTPISKFGSKADISEKFIDKLYKSGIVEKILEISNIHNNKQLAKTDGKKRNIIRGMAKLEDANWAGTAKSKECTLILTEGDSAASMAIAGLAEVGRDRFGVFPLKGKLMNVKDQTLKKIAENDEISNLKKILGLETGKQYSTVDELRYGKIMILTDQDTDGSHIKGLLFNMFHSMWPSLVKCNTFLSSMLTPIIKTTKGQQVLEFYNMTDYENWLQQTNAGKGWEIKYYKGLGTSTSEEAKQYFKDLKMISYLYNGEASDERLDLAFNKKKADERKDWLGGYDRQNILDYTARDVSFEDFVDKELIHFSNYDVERSIPNICDGLKVSQRKILFACFKKNLTKEIKVAQLAGYVSENAAYHHGEASLQSAIIGMAQNFVGSNNINMLKPNGQFGTRRLGGKDASAPRYIFTQLEDITGTIFNKADNAVLTYLNDDGLSVEPEYYIPIIPMVLVNGAVGIGTGFSTNIPCYNPLDIINTIKSLLAQEDICHDLVPWYRGFKGIIEKNDQGKYVSRGTFVKTAATKVDITELPIGMWTQSFKEMLEDYMEKCPDIKNYDSHYTETNIKFTLHFTNAATCMDYLTVQDNGYTKLENELKLVSSKVLGTTNMYLFNQKCQIQKYDTPVDIIREFYQIRLGYYQRRKDHILQELQYDIRLLDNKIRFIKEVVAEHVVVHKMKKNELEAYLVDNEYMLHNDSYDYILRIPIYNLTIDKVEELENEKQKADEEYNRISGIDIGTWWSEELDEFAKAYTKFLDTNKQEKKKTLKKA
jgi:DNA topoisomerase-2